MCRRCTSDLLKKTVFKNLHAEFPDKIVNKTNGITPRRWLSECNPALSQLISETIGAGWETDIGELQKLADYADDPGFQASFGEAKRRNKRSLIDYLGTRVGVTIDIDSLFDVQIKRFHEYKRQLLNVFETVALYDDIRQDPDAGWRPRVKIFAGKAAPSYHTAKLIIKLINDIARVVNQDPHIRGLLKVVQLPNYNVSLAERLIPAADLSEQISTAGYEASGTGNMKFALNGAITVGTLDGANVEIREHVGDDNIFIFGLTADEVAAETKRGYDARATVAAEKRLQRAISMIAEGHFSPEDRGRFRSLIDGVLNYDRFLVTADFTDYYATQRKIDEVFADKSAWLRMAILNTANMGWFSSDRTIQEYADEIWRAPHRLK